MLFAMRGQQLKVVAAAACVPVTDLSSRLQDCAAPAVETAEEGLSPIIFDDPSTPQAEDHRLHPLLLCH